jgi:hypothetical protein
VRDLALFVADPIHLAGSELPLVAQCALELGLGQARGQPATDELRACLGSLGPARCLSRAILQGRHGQDAINAGLWRHGSGVDVGSRVVHSQRRPARCRSAGAGWKGERGAVPNIWEAEGRAVGDCGEFVQKQLCWKLKRQV